MWIVKEIPLQSPRFPVHLFRFGPWIDEYLHVIELERLGLSAARRRIAATWSATAGRPATGSGRCHRRRCSPAGPANRNDRPLITLTDERFFAIRGQLK